MRVPVRIPVGGKVVRVKYPQRIPGDTPEEGDVAGDTTHDGLEIRVSRTRNFSAAEVFQTLFHELTHSAMAITGVAQLFKEIAHEEAVVYALENMLAPLFVLRGQTGLRWREVEFPFED